MEKKALRHSLSLASAVALVAVVWSLPTSANRDVNQIGQRLHSAADGCSPVANTPFFTIAYGTVQLGTVEAPVTTIVEALSPRGDRVGCFEISHPGEYGAMYIFGEDTGCSPPIPGMQDGEEITFRVNGELAEATPVLHWHNDRELHPVQLVAELDPTGLTLASLTAIPAVEHIQVEWETATEVDLVGFNLVRAQSSNGVAEGTQVRLNDSLIPSQVPGSQQGALYAFHDRSAIAGITYYYWLEELSVCGNHTRLHGPVSAARESYPFSLYLPVVTYRPE